MVCSYFKKGHCLRGKGNCTMKQGPGCRTRDFFIFTEKGNALEPGSSVLSRPLTSDTGCGGLSSLRTPLLSGCVCSLGVVGKFLLTWVPSTVLWHWIWIPSLPDGWKHNHTELDCSDYCSRQFYYFGALKISTFCCKGQEFCNKYQGNQQEYKE